MEIADMTLEDYILLKQNIDTDNLIYEFLSAINFLHENNFVHCDLKPDNILIKNNRLKLADLGLANLKYLTPDLCLHAIFSPPEFVLHSLKQSTKDYNKLKNFLNNNYKFLSAESLDIWASGMIIYYILQKRFLLPDDTFIFVSRYIDFIKDYKNILKYNLSKNNMKYYDILLKCLEPNAYLRASNIKDVFVSSPIYSPGIKDNLISGLIKYNDIYYEIKNYNISANDFELFIKYDIGLETYFGFLDLFYRSMSILINEQIKDLFNTCLLMACKIYDIKLFYFLFNIINFKDYNKMEFKILESLNGKVVYNNFYTYGFSLDSMLKIFEYTINSRLYLITDQEEVMKTLAIMETEEELKNRENKNIKFKHYMNYIEES